MVSDDNIIFVASNNTWSDPGGGEFPAQMAGNAENVSIWWRHHGLFYDGRTRQLLRGVGTVVIFESTLVVADALVLI